MTIKEADRLTELRFNRLPQGVTTLAPFTVAKARGATLWDDAGNEFTDFVGGIGVQNIGHNHPTVTAAVRAQLDQFMHTSINVVAYEGYLRVVDELCRRTALPGPLKGVLFNSGAEAVENAIKIARAATGRRGVIAFTGAFHGRTHFALSLTGRQDPYKKGFGISGTDVYRAPYPYAGDPASAPGDDFIDRIEELFFADVNPAEVAAVIIEPVCGEGGFMPASFDFLRKLQDLCRSYGIQLIVDEVQTGYYRTGKMFAFEHSGIEPDLVVIAKSLAAGMPLSAVVGRAELLDAVHAGGIGGTYAGNPLSCAAALAVFEVIDGEGIESKAAEIGERLDSEFWELAREFPQIREVRGLGAMLALELAAEDGAPYTALVKDVMRFALEDGLVLMNAGAHGNVIRCLVPLTASEHELERGFSILRKALKRATSPNRT